jgi:hypothetical protein
MNTSAGILFVGIGLALLWLAITGRLQAMLDAVTGAARSPAPAVAASGPTIANFGPGYGTVGYGVLAATPGAPGTLEAVPGYGLGTRGTN